MNNEKDSRDRGPESFPDWLESGLRSLPRHKAEAEFTSRVLARVPRYRQASSPGMRRLALPLAAAVLLAVLIPIALRMLSGPANQPEQTAYNSLIESLRLEQQRLQAELAELRSQFDRQTPVVYLGGDEQLGFALDLRRLAAERAARDGAVQAHPAVMRRGADGYNDPQR
ncbi:MAG: hypothetical protein JSV80_13830 [Acidobacteriota bacterium]|nr:MAG: hypothetical protein JSV80_13830 [Acidobacteriota bacterium]